MKKPIQYACLYYGYPSSFSGTWDIDDCAHLFAEYDIVVWGDLYQMPEHEDYVNAKQIASKMLKQHKGLEFFGYVPIGLHPSQKESNLSIEEIKKRIQYWRIVGGITPHFIFLNRIHHSLLQSSL